MISQEERAARREIARLVPSDDPRTRGMAIGEPRYTWLEEEVSAVQFLALLREQQAGVELAGYQDTEKLGVYHPPAREAKP